MPTERGACSQQRPLVTSASLHPDHKDNLLKTKMTTPASDSYAYAQPPIPYERLGFGWGAVLAGLAVAMALNVFFAEVGLWMNLGIIDRQSSGGAIVAVNAIAWVVSGLVALFAGAWVAGRMASARTVIEGSLHGIAVWAAGAVVMLLLAFSAAGVIGGGMISLVGKGLAGAGQLAEVVAPSWDNIREELDGALVERDASAGAAPADGQQRAADGETGIRDRSRLFELAGRHFALDESGPVNAAEREELVQLIAAQTGISKPAAEQTLAQWDKVWEGTVQRYETAKAEALQAAEAARRATMAAAAWAAVAMLLSAGAALVGGGYGASCRLRLVRRHVVVHSETKSSASLPLPRRVESGKAQHIG